MIKKFFVLTGAPGSGKSTIVTVMRHLGFSCIEEPARQILAEQRSINSAGLPENIGKYLSGLRKLNHILVLKAGFETQLRTPCLLIPCGMRALSMTRQIREGRLQSSIQPRDVPGLQGLHQVT